MNSLIQILGANPNSSPAELLQTVTEKQLEDAKVRLAFSKFFDQYVGTELSHHLVRIPGKGWKATMRPVIEDRHVPRLALKALSKEFAKVEGSDAFAYVREEGIDHRYILDFFAFIRGETEVITRGNAPILMDLAKKYQVPALEEACKSLLTELRYERTIFDREQMNRFSQNILETETIKKITLVDSEIPEALQKQFTTMLLLCPSLEQVAIGSDLLGFNPLLDLVFALVNRRRKFQIEINDAEGRLSDLLDQIRNAPPLRGEHEIFIDSTENGIVRITIR